MIAESRLRHELSEIRISLQDPPNVEMALRRVANIERALSAEIQKSEISKSEISKSEISKSEIQKPDFEIEYLRKRLREMKTLSDRMADVIQKLTAIRRELLTPTDDAYVLEQIQ